MQTEPFLIVIADLPQPHPGYKAWLIKDDTAKISTGVLRLAKGGYLFGICFKYRLFKLQKVEVKLGRGSYFQAHSRNN